MHKINPELIQGPTDLKVTGNAMKKLMFLGVVLLSSTFNILPVEAQEPAPLIQFNNGEAADADDVNTNFNNHERRLQALEQYQGCSASQDGSSVVITCADGSSGVLASAGTVVVYPEGNAVTSDISTFNSGDIYFVDANGVVLGRGGTYGPYTVLFIKYGNLDVMSGIANISASQTVEVAGFSNSLLYYQSSDCSGAPLITNLRNEIFKDGDDYYVKNEASAAIQIVANSRKFVDRSSWIGSYYIGSQSCESTNQIVEGKPLITFELPAELLNAAYPVRLEQLP
jgi:hypothetical protein